MAEAKDTQQEFMLDTAAIEKLIPHRYPFLMVDRVIGFVDNESVVCMKNVTANEPYFTGHFPGKPVMPGVMMLEAMAQSGAILAKLSSEGVKGDRIIYLVGADEVKFKKMVTPGDSLKISSSFIKRRRPMWIIQSTVTVGDELVCSARITAIDSE